MGVLDVAQLIINEPNSNDKKSTCKKGDLNEPIQ